MRDESFGEGMGAVFMAFEAPVIVPDPHSHEAFHHFARSIYLARASVFTSRQIKRSSLAKACARFNCVRQRNRSLVVLLPISSSVKIRIGLIFPEEIPATIILAGIFGTCNPF